MTLNWRGENEEYRWLAALAGLTVLAFLIASLAGYATGLPAWKIVFFYVKVVWILGPGALMIAAIPIAIRFVVMRIRNPVGEVVAYACSRFGSPALAAGTLLPILAIPVLMGSFGTLKMLMPLARDFTWDDWLATADKMLFLGYQPWQFTHALFGGAHMTQIIDLIYSLWVALLFTAVLFYSLLAPRYERARFFLAFAASWLLIGIAGAYLFASAGPCYAELIGAQSAVDFAPLMERLKAMHEGGTKLGAYEWQGVLWNNHVAHRYGFAMGISAMPSMHNAVTVLYALSLGRASRTVRIAAWSFVAIIFIGSIHLGWHYAVDGIAAGAMMWGIWAAAGAFLERVGYTAALRGDDEDSQPDLPDFTPEPVPA
jgi:hypothetical protein